MEQNKGIIENFFHFLFFWVLHHAPYFKDKVEGGAVSSFETSEIFSISIWCNTQKDLQ